MQINCFSIKLLEVMNSANTSSYDCNEMWKKASQVINKTGSNEMHNITIWYQASNFLEFLFCLVCKKPSQAQKLNCLHLSVHAKNT